MNVKKKYMWYVTCILLTLSILISAYILMGFYPFGSKSIYISDLHSQYRGFLMYAKNLMMGEESAFFSWHFFSGSNMIGNVAYYMGSIFNFVLLVVPDEYFYFGIVIIIALKFTAISCSMFTFLNNSFTNKQEVSLFLSLYYTFSGMFIGYFFNIIWLDSFILFPLFLNELVYSIREKEVRIRYIFLFLFLIIANFYIAYIIILFSLFFVLAGLYINNYSRQDVFKICSKLIGYAMFSLMLSSVIVIPTIFQLLEGLRNQTGTAEIRFSIAKLSAKIFNGVYFNRSFISSSKSVYPHLYSGILPIMTVPIFFMSKKVSRRERVCFGILFSFIVFSFIFPFLGYIWHVFSYPTGFPYRFSFVFSFLTIFLCALGMEKEIFNLKNISISGLLFSMVLMVLLFKRELNFTLWFWNQALVIFWFIILMFIDSFKRNKAALIVSIICVCLEVSVHQVLTLAKMDNVTPFNEYEKNESEIVSELNDIKKRITSKSSDLTRFISLDNQFETDNLYYRFPSVSGFSSMGNKKYMKMMSNLGYPSSYVKVNKEGGTMLTDILLRNQYKLVASGDSNSDDNQFDLIAKGKYIDVLQAKYQSPVGFLMNGSDANATSLPDIQNSIIRSLGGEPNEFLKYYEIKHKQATGVVIKDGTLNQVSEEAAYTFALPRMSDDDILYVFFPPYFINNIKYILNGEVYDIVPGWHQLNNTSSDEIMIVWNENQIIQDFQLYFMTIDSEKLLTLVSNSGNSGLDIDEMASQSFSGSIKTDDRADLILPIPFDKGWQFYINKKEIDISTGFGGLILLTDLPKHQEVHISAVYTSPGFELGKNISIVTLFALIIFLSRKSSWIKSLITKFDWYKRKYC